MVAHWVTIPEVNPRCLAKSVAISMPMDGGECSMIFRIRIRIASLLLTAAERLAFLARKIAPRC